MMTYREKIGKYQAGKWKCPPPPVCWLGWDRDAWISWIDYNGVWL